ncbi:uncharacterized protein NEPAR06_0864 [Nematocida parisii]|uniref:Uncharacterized protein n=1 Tax=Nematocida parisii (strain ERTm3) TaxID=935791 RepID=I3EER2_NEMP3|nr:uncharacterized protein NEPG_02338 [Nematocida parisii ERTm1]EIJ87709.1 hypothetical protein NEQG_02256 [Nematocida parisii ERTm3]KAI5127737.1 uncharacterized protein NEPAR03_1076 [Nematocida parisii]EIJ92939.1 hypothetical protein NEPG_02338 [Nematocida parisii ERTm1]KAI5128893.1 uncharacterized protein NEPAR08_1380 [Nematocida parisii]KAI5141578.1 uncharacterized protein NEPAR04_1068 [Nematocida parisii]|eukprot:XP_013060165.1 hypothetical protein NEPG_02338 [Nematocida parisii ERTm1]
MAVHSINKDIGIFIFSHKFNFMRVAETGVVISCEVKPKCKFFMVEWANDILYISLTEMAIENRANKEVIETFHEIFRRPRSTIKIIAGLKSRAKSVLLENITEEEARKDLNKLNK